MKVLMTILVLLLMGKFVFFYNQHHNKEVVTEETFPAKTIVIDGDCNG